MDFKAEALKYREEFLDLLAQWISIKSVYEEESINEAMPFGKGVSEALDWFINLGKKDGFLTKNIDGYAAHAEYGIGEEYVYAFGHCDVVPEGEGWLQDPYKLLKEGDKLVGRGVTDDKGPVLAAYLALKLLRDNNILPTRKIRVAVGGNEESGFRCIRHYFTKEPKPVFGFTPDAKFPVINGEMGGAVITISGSIEDKELYIRGGQVHNTIPDYALIKGSSITENLVRLHKEDTIKLQHIYEENKEEALKLIGKGGHSSKPKNANNPIEALFRYLEKVTGEEWTKKFCTMFGGGNREGELFGLKKQGKCGKLIIVPTIIHVEKGGFNLTLSIRYPETLCPEEIINKIRACFAVQGLNNYEICISGIKKPSYVDEEAPLVKALHNIYIKHTGDNKNKVRVTSAGTYASEMENSVVFGGEFPDGSFGNVHSANEYGSEEAFIKSIGIYAEAFYELGWL